MAIEKKSTLCNWPELGKSNASIRSNGPRAQWFQMAKNPPKNKLTPSDFTVFPYKFLHILITSVSGLCRRFTFKICQTVAGTSMIRQFRISFLVGFWYLAQQWAGAA